MRLLRGLFSREDSFAFGPLDDIGFAPVTRDSGRRETTARFVAVLILAAAQFSMVDKLGWHGIGLVAGIVSILSLASWAAWLVGWAFPSRYSPYLAFGGILVMGTGGALLSGLLVKNTGVSPAFPAIASVVVAARWPPTRAAVVVGWFEVVLLTAAASQGWHQLATNGLGYGSLLGGMYGLGVGRRSYILRAQSAEKLVKETERANHEEAHAAALAERSRIAREIHDVLAHSLAALTVQLEAADALLEAGGEEGLAKAHGYVQKSRRIAREGLIETRRAIAALREDAPPLPELLHALADAYRSDTGAPAEVQLKGLPRPLQADAGLTVYRAAQESLTNVRKHAPGAPVWLTMVFGEEELVLTVANGAPTEPPNDLAGSGGGYGLAGLKERAELIGGSLEAGPRSSASGTSGAADGVGSGVGGERTGDQRTQDGGADADTIADGGWQVTLRLHG
jgi:signal transduction histidine kinase